jgi:hypothetical protein
MSVSRETLYKLIADIPPQDVEKVADFIGYLNMKRERESAEQLALEPLSQDENLIKQVNQSKADE